MNPRFDSAVELLWQLLSPFSSDDRYWAIVGAVSFQPAAEWEPADLIGRVRAAFADVWESMGGQAVPVKALAAITASHDRRFRSQLWAASESNDIEDFTAAVKMLIGILRRLGEMHADRERVDFALECSTAPRNTVHKPVS